MKKLFGDFNISWKFLILFSSIIGIVVGIMNCIPALNNTSFQDIAIYLEMWIILAIFIIVNTKSAKEAMLKCFIFFLISQPLIYMVEVLINVFIYNKDFIEMLKLFFVNYYIGADWLLYTFLTIPGAFVAYQIKKDNILSSLVLSVATSYLTFIATLDSIKLIQGGFPYHLLTILICYVMAYYLIFIILKKKTNRIICFILTTLSIAGAILYYNISLTKPMIINELVDLDNIAVSCESKNENIATVKCEDKVMDVQSSKEVGKTVITVKDEKGKKLIYEVNSTAREFNVKLKK